MMIDDLSNLYNDALRVINSEESKKRRMQKQQEEKEDARLLEHYMSMVSDKATEAARSGLSYAVITNCGSFGRTSREEPYHWGVWDKLTEYCEGLGFTVDYKNYTNRNLGYDYYNFEISGWAK